MAPAQARLHQLAFDVLDLSDQFEEPTASTLSRLSMDLFAAFEREVAEAQ